MNNRFLTLIPLIAGSAFILPGCGDNSSFEAPNTTATDTPQNLGTVAQKNLSIGADDAQPKVFDVDKNVFTEQTVQITVKVGDINNQLLTGSHTIFFATEWGLINPSCVTENGKCTVTWQTSSFGNVPNFLLSTVTAWTLGEENFTDSNGNGTFDDTDTTFEDREEPYIDAVLTDGGFNAATGDKVINVVNGNDTSGTNGVHDIGDGLLNSPNCTHSSLCSTIQPTSYIWVDMELDLAGPPPATTVP